MIDKIVKIAVPTIAIWIAKKIKDKYDEAQKKSHDEGYSKGRSEGYSAGKEAGKNAPRFQDFTFNENGLDSETDKSLWCERLIQSLNDQEHINEKTRAERYGGLFTLYKWLFDCIVVPRYPWRMPKSKDDTTNLVKLDICYKLLRDEYLLGLNEGLESSETCETKALMDSWYLTQRERYLRACIVNESAYSTDLSLLNLTRLEGEIKGICQKYTESQRDDRAKLKEYVSESFEAFERVRADLEELEDLNPYYPKKTISLETQKEAWLEIMLEYWFGSFEGNYKESEPYKQLKEAYQTQWSKASQEADLTQNIESDLKGTAHKER